MRTDRHEQEYWSLPPNCSAHIHEWLKNQGNMLTFSPQRRKSPTRTWVSVSSTKRTNTHDCFLASLYFNCMASGSSQITSIIQDGEKARITKKGKKRGIQGKWFFLCSPPPLLCVGTWGVR